MHKGKGIANDVESRNHERTYALPLPSLRPPPKRRKKHESSSEEENEEARYIWIPMKRTGGFAASKSS